MQLPREKERKTGSLFPYHGVEALKKEKASDPSLAPMGEIPIVFPSRMVISRNQDKWDTDSVMKRGSRIRGCALPIASIAGNSDPRAMLLQMPPFFDLEGDIGVVGRCCTALAHDDESDDHDDSILLPASDYGIAEHGGNGKIARGRCGGKRRCQILDIKGDMLEVSRPQQLAGTCLVLKIALPKGEAGLDFLENVYVLLQWGVR